MGQLASGRSIEHPVDPSSVVRRRYVNLHSLAATGVGAGPTSADTQGMVIRYYVDPDTSLPHIHSHGVHEDEVEDVLRKSGEERPGTEGSRVALGQTRAGPYLRVIYPYGCKSGT